MLNRNLNRRSFLRASTGLVLAGSAARRRPAYHPPAPVAPPHAAPVRPHRTPWPPPHLHDLVYYLGQYDGVEASKTIFYVAAPPNQKIIPGVTYLLQKGMKNMYLLGSGYVFPRTANKAIKAQLAAEGGKTVAEDCTPL